MATISKRAFHTPSSPIRKLHELAENAKRKGIKVLSLNIGQPDLLTPNEFFRRTKNFSDKVVAYAPSAGYQEVIQAWQKYYQHNGINFKEQDIIVTTGGSEAIIFALLSVADSGDEVLVFEPLYTNYITFACMTGVSLKPITLAAKDGFRLPSEKTIKKCISKKTKAIIVCNPSNPTGTVFNKKELRAIIRIAQRNNLYIIADETYREIVFTPMGFVSLMDFPAVRDRIIVVDSVSKRFNICGARIGCLASKDLNIVSSALKFAQGRLSSPTIEQLAVVPLLKRPVFYTKPSVSEYRLRRDVLMEELKKIEGVECCNADGAFYIMATLPVKSTEDFCQWLVEKFSYKGETLLLAPGDGFYVTKSLGKREVRIAYVLNRRALKKAMYILKIALNKYLNK